MPDIVGVLIILGAAGAIVWAVIRSGRRLSHNDTDVTPTPPPPDPALTEAPEFLGIHELLAGYVPAGGWIEGNHTTIQVTYHTHGCRADNTFLESGFRDNGTGPYEYNAFVEIEGTKSPQPIYDIVDMALSNGEWRPCNQHANPAQGAFVVYMGRRRPWANIQTGGNCNPTITPIPRGEVPSLPVGERFAMLFTVRIRNRYKNETHPKTYRVEVERRICGRTSDEHPVIEDDGGLVCRNVVLAAPAGGSKA